MATEAQLKALRGASSWVQWRAEYRFGLRWVLRERGFAVLLFLALLNAVANGWSVAGDSSALIRAMEFHARLFAILIATIYAGELVWRDRDVRVQELLDALPVQHELRLAARSSGVLTALLTLPLSTAMAAILLALTNGSREALGAALGAHVACSLTWLAGVGSLQFVVLFAISLAVHRVVQHKTAAHLLLIAAWVIAIAAGADALAQPWQVWGDCP